MVIHFPESASNSIFVKSRPKLLSAYVTDAKLSRDTPRLLHSHPHVEVLYVYDGGCDYLVGGNKYLVQKGDLILFNAGLLHGEDPRTQDPLCSYCIAMTDIYCRALPPNHLTLPDILPVIHCGKDAKTIEKLMQTICFSDENERNGSFCGALAITLLCYCYDRLSGTAGSAAGQIRYKLVQQAKDYIDEHFCEELNLDELAESLHVSKYYLSHSFKKITHYSPKQYLISRRIGEGQTLLMNSTLPVAEIGSRTGYPDACHYNSIFKKYVGLTPGQYRRAFLSYQEIRRDG